MGTRYEADAVRAVRRDDDIVQLPHTVCLRGEAHVVQPEEVPAAYARRLTQQPRKLCGVRPVVPTALTALRRPAQQHANQR